MSKHAPCPRCGGPVPNAEHEGQYPGAVSRADNETTVCSACGQDEAMMQFFDGGTQPVSEWPIEARRYTMAYDLPDDEDS